MRIFAPRISTGWMTHAPGRCQQTVDHIAKQQRDIPGALTQAALGLVALPRRSLTPGSSVPTSVTVTSEPERARPLLRGTWTARLASVAAPDERPYEPCPTALDDSERAKLARGLPPLPPSGCSAMYWKKSVSTPSRSGCETDRVRPGDEGAVSVADGIVVMWVLVAAAANVVERFVSVCGLEKGPRKRAVGAGHVVAVRRGVGGL